MINDSFSLYIRDNIGAGQQHIASLSRSVVEQADSNLAEYVRHNGDEAYLDPLIFAMICQADIAIDPAQLLLGYMKPENRVTGIEVITDETGLAYLPRIGYFATGVPDSMLRMIGHISPDQCIFFDGTEQLVHRFKPLRTVADGSIEVLQGKHPLLMRYFVDTEGNPAPFQTDEISVDQTENLDKALHIINQVHPHYYDCIRAVTRDVVIFHSDPMNSFATLAAHGAAFLNTSVHDDEVFFIEDLAHQCGHIVFNALTFETDTYLLVPKDTPLRDYNNHERETRSVYDAFHGLFTEAMMYECLNECYLQKIFTGRQEQELIGRMSFILSRFALDLNLFARYPLLTESGLWLLGNIMKIFKAGYEARWQDIQKLEFTNQGYNFSYDKFAQANGMVQL